jgi:glycosyltransferase involved in cell wall biosynthesis
VKILQVIPTLEPSVGGVAPAMLGLSRGLIRRGHEVEVVTLDPPSSEWLRGMNWPVHAMGRGLTKYGYSPALDRWLKEYGQSYERVIVNGVWQYPGFAVWRWFRRSETPYYVFPHGMLDPWFKRTYPLKHLKKWLYWPWAEYRVLRDAAAVIFTSDQERLQARESFWLYQARERVSSLGVEVPAETGSASKEMFLQKFPRLRDTKPLLFLGRLHPKKGCDLAIEAFAAAAERDNGISLVMAGPDQVGWERELKDRTKQLGVDSRVVFTGMLGGELKRGALMAADAFILPSHQENFGMAVIEALAAGVPVLISNRINTAHEIETNHAGYVANDDLLGTKSLIERWRDTAIADRDTMRQNARNCFANRFEINRAVDSLLEILSEPFYPKRRNTAALQDASAK